MSDVSAQPDLVSMRECARRLTEAGYRVDESTIGRQVKSGMIPNRGTTDRPLVDADEVIRLRAANVDVMKRRGAPLLSAGGDPNGEGGTSPAPAAEGTLHRARMAKEGIQARLAQLNLERQLGNLVDKAEVQDLFYDLGEMIRAQLAQRAEPLAAKLQGLDPVHARAAIDAADRDLLLQLRQLVEARLAEAGVANVAA